ncbi:MAG: NADH-quinone oxidoreductase subunit C [Sandaracinaceae bacterium]|nr:NADH-quinone oxidoreductase subunit C [Sandaracinaceae bacterium]
MSVAVLARLQAEFGAKILETSSFRGDDEAIVAPSDWAAVAAFLRADSELVMDHFIDITAIDYPERTPQLPRFDVVLLVRSMSKNHRVRLKTRVQDGEELDTLVPVWRGANWTEREVFDMFGIRFRGHPDMRRILLYEEFVGYPLRKDYPIDKTQPLIEYRKEDNLEKLPPFGPTEGQPWNRIDWQARLEGRDMQVSPAIAVQQGQKHALSESSARAEGKPLPDEIPGKN